MLSRNQVQGAGQSAPITIHMNINTPDAHSFRQTQGQIVSDMTRRMARVGGRNM